MTMNAGDMCDIQPSSIAVPQPKEDVPIASSSNGKASQFRKLPRRVSKTFSKALLASVEEHSATMHTIFGVKVRDFAYQSTLPPVAVVPHIPVQVQPGIRSLKRGLRAYDEDNGEEGDPPGRYTFSIDANSVGSSHPKRRRTEPRLIERTLTEPVEEDDLAPSQGRPLRSLAFNHLSRRGRDLATSGPATPSRPRLHIPGTSKSPPPFDPDTQSQPGPSQESEPWIDTPLVTPNGSLQWNVQDTSAIPASQLDAASQLPVPGEDVTFSQLGFSPGRSQLPATPIDTSPSRNARRNTQPQRRSSLTPSSCANRSSPIPESPLRESVETTPEKSTGHAATDVMPENQIPRYHLRDRPPAPPRTATRPRKRARGGSTVVAHEAAATTRSSTVRIRKPPQPSPAVRPTRRSARIGHGETGTTG